MQGGYIAGQQNTGAITTLQAQVATLQTQVAVLQASQVILTKVSFTDTQIRNSFTTPLQLLPALPVGQTYALNFIMGRKAGTAFGTNTTIQILFSGSAMIVLTDTGNLLGSSANRTLRFSMFTPSGALVNLQYTNAALMMQTTVGNPTAGVGAVTDFYIYYTILTL